METQIHKQMETETGTTHLQAFGFFGNGEVSQSTSCPTREEAPDIQLGRAYSPLK